MPSVSHRTVTEDVHDGSSGAKIEEKTVHQIGVTIDGVFIPFLSKGGDYIDAQVAQAKAAESTPEEA